MGRHGTAGRRPGAAARLRPSWLAITLVLLVLGAIGLGVWWWTLQPPADPIDADPVGGTAVVLSSHPCSVTGTTSVRITSIDPPVTASLNGCGFADGQQVAVQYLAGHPQQVRLAGTSTAGERPLAVRMLPFGILLAGVAAVAALVALLVERRQRRRRRGAGRVTVADLHARIEAAREAPDGEG